MADNFDQQIMDFLHHVQKLNPDVKTQAKMTNAGAKVLKSKLEQATREKHYDSKYYIAKRYRGKNIKHLADSVEYSNTNLNGEVDGSSIVGFQGIKSSGVNHARIARFINDGTKKMRGDHFVEHTRKDYAQQVFKANAEAYQAHVRGDD
ncbi:HK97-gp10 family putative phage morphogenesis protein [Limosilactobacillus portuensis]|uniref:HK97-gp10 family putative phage morphogenesis protein n=1 Tax=Limosilactobacillus portuensis TaxID=2742601 RepID=UPI002358A71F|nr:HK97-gp10 family putative phage morphogenesis protein [Limosilactobacillus portuensis]WCT61283.1 HK97 gp10 family phage protein [Limosilactobacillus portuensis]